MSSFYETLPKSVNLAFKRRKKNFKRGKDCAICGKKLHRQEDRYVDHIIPVYMLNDYEALYNQDNWQVLCLDCKKEKDRNDQRLY